METIGLEGVMALDGFDRGMSQYLSAINKANDQTEKTAGTFSQSFGSMGASVNHVAGIMGGALIGATASIRQHPGGDLRGALPGGENSIERFHSHTMILAG